MIERQGWFVLRIAGMVLLTVLAGCAQSPNGTGWGPRTSPLATLGSTPFATLGSTVDRAEVAAALKAAAAAGPIRFTTSARLVAEGPGYTFSTSQSEGVIDLAQSRGSAVTEALPGILRPDKNELMLLGDRIFVRPDPAHAWEERYGGAAAFLGLDALTVRSAAVDALDGALPDGPWVVVRAEGGDPRGSIRIEAPGPDGRRVAVVINADRQLARLVVSSRAGDKGKVVQDLVFTAFGVPLDLPSPGPIR